MKKGILFVLLPLAALFLLVVGDGRTAAQAGDQILPVIGGFPSGWTTPVNISNTPANSESPVAAVDTNGKNYVTWTEWYGGVGDRRDMMFNTDASGQWGTSSGPSLNYTAIDDVGFPNMGVTTDGSAVYQTYHDGDFSLSLMGIFFRQRIGGSWSQPVNISGAPAASSYATLAVSPVDNSVFVVYMADVGGFDLALRYKDGATGQWSSPTLFLSSQSGGKYLPHLFIDKNGTAHVVYIVRSPAEVWYSKNTTPKNPNTWTTPFNISGGTGLDWTYPKVVADVDSPQNAYIVWQTVVGTTTDIMLRKQVNGAWQSAENVSQAVGLSETASLALDTKNKDLYIVWQSRIDSSNWEVMLRANETQASGQKAWSEIYRLTNSPGHSGEPCIRLDVKGNLHLFYFDNPYGGDGDAEIMYSTKQRASDNMLTLTSPNGGESWPGTSIHNITWATKGTVANVKIEASTNGGTSFSQVVASIPNTGTYAWTVPNTPSANCLVRISSPADATISDTSDAPFAIVQPPKPQAPLSVSLDTRLDGTGTKKINAVVWQANPANAALPLKNYRIYRKRSTQADSFYAFLAAVSGTTLQYEDTGLEVLQKYAYRVTALSMSDDESDPSATIVETKKFEFSPLNLAVQTAFNRILFFQVKLNTLTFEKNPLNDETEVSGYKVYRRKAEEGNSAYTLISTLGGSTFTFRDGTSASARLTVNQKYAYSVTTTFSDGRESGKAEILTDK